MELDLNDTYKLVRRVFSREQEMLTRESARSVLDRKEFASYHYSEILRLSKTFERKHLAETRSILELHVQGAEKKEQAFQVYMVKAGAHSLAAVQCLHAIPDIFAHAVYFASGQNLQPHALADKDISLPGVVGCLKKDKKFAALSSPLTAIQSGKGWSHLAAVSNMSKHRSVVRASYNEDWTGKRTKVRELQITAFERHEKSYPAISLQELLEPEYKRLMNAVISIIQELNHRLQSV